MTYPYVLGVDQGGSGSRALILDTNGAVAGYGYHPVRRIYPQPGWVEQSPAAIAASVRAAIDTAIIQAGCRASEIAACGITTQRDTVFAWDAETGQPIGNAITWQDMRTTALVAEANSWEYAEERRARLGQFPGAYCSAMHMAWRMRHDQAFRQAAEAGRLQCSLAAGWLVQALGQLDANVLDYSLMQGMTIFDFRAKQLWQEWIEYLNLPRAALPRPVPTIYPFGTLAVTDSYGGQANIPVLAMISDQQAALFGYDCRASGQAACTHGTASFVNVVAGSQPPPPGRTKIYLAWELAGQPTYSLEADTTVTGAVIRWMQEQMGWLQRPADLGALAASVPDAGGVVFVPAFTGLGIPIEDRTARGTLLGMTLDTTPAHIARAFLNAIGCQLHDILTAIAEDASITIDQLYVGGGVSASDVACQAQADLLGIPVLRADNTETSVRAAALLAGLGAGTWPNTAALPRLPGEPTVFEPRMTTTVREAILAQWQRAITRSLDWV